MKVMLDIQDSKAGSLMEVLHGLSYVKTKQITKPVAEFIDDIKISVEEMKETKKGKLKPRLATDFLNEI